MDWLRPPGTGYRPWFCTGPPFGVRAACRRFRRSGLPRPYPPCLTTERTCPAPLLAPDPRRTKLWPLPIPETEVDVGPKPGYTTGALTTAERASEPPRLRETEWRAPGNWRPSPPGIPQVGGFLFALPEVRPHAAKDVGERQAGNEATGSATPRGSFFPRFALLAPHRSLTTEQRGQVTVSLRAWEWPCEGRGPKPARTNRKASSPARQRLSRQALWVESRWLVNGGASNRPPRH